MTLYRSHILLIVLLYCILPTGCSTDDANNPMADEAHGFMFRIVTENTPRSRAIGDLYDEMGSQEENMINIEGGDYRIYLFAGSTGNDAKLVSNISFNFSCTSGNYTEYLAWQKIDNAFFLQNNISLQEETDYQLVVLANWQSMNATYPTLTAGSSTMADLMDATHVFKQPDAAWQPFTTINKNTYKGIPMFGRKTFKARPSDLVLPADPTSLPGDSRYNVKEVWMMRALAKMEIWDFATPADNNVSITNLALKVGKNGSKITQIGEAVPDGYAEGQQVTAVTMPANPDKTAFTPTFALAAEGKLYRKHVCYLPEQQLTQATTDAAGTSLYIKYSAVISNNNTTKEEYYQLYGNICPNGQILRNHIYRVQITSDGVIFFTLKWGTEQLTQDPEKGVWDPLT